MNKQLQRYDSASIAFHWITVLLIVAVYACIELREFYPKGSEMRNAFKEWHFMLGLTVFVLTFGRVVVRLRSVRPPIHPPLMQAQEMLIKLMHGLLYGLLLLMPLLGWVILSGEGHAVPFWGLELPALMAENEELAEAVEDIHKTIGKAGYFLIGAHAMIALLHHYLRRDNALERMMPRMR